MREHLYRGKRKDNGEWMCGNLQVLKPYGQDSVYLISKQNYKNEEDDDYAVIVSPETVGEYTGLTDRYCNKIFEGDIVECYRYANGKGGKLVFENLTVVWDDMLACFALAEVGVGHISYRYNEYDMDDTHEFHVIGNIHDSPELLNKGE